MIKQFKLSLAQNHIQHEPFTFIIGGEGDISADIWLFLLLANMFIDFPEVPETGPLF